MGAEVWTVVERLGERQRQTQIWSGSTNLIMEKLYGVAL